MNKLLKTIKKLSGSAEIFIVGGWLRDRLIKRANRDLDLAVSKDPADLAKKFARKTRGTFVVLDDKNKIYRVVLKNNPVLDCVDFTKMKGKTILEDLANRDFTINSLALELTEKTDINLSKIVDPLGGRKDILKKQIKADSSKVFKDDSLRLLRAYRHAAELGFSIDNTTLKLIKKESAKIKNAASERVREELFKILSQGQANISVRNLEKSGLFGRIVPETNRMKKSARQFYFHPLGLWQHAMETLSSLEYIYDELNRFFPERHEEINKHLSEPLSQGASRRSLLKLVALLHDVAKPVCARRVGGRMRFLGHDTKGAKMIANIFRRLRMSGQEIKIGTLLVENHMRPIGLGQAKSLTDRAYYRLFRDIGDNVPDIALLSLADCYSYRKMKTAKPEELRQQERVMKEIINRYYADKEKPALPRIIDGNILIKKLKLAPGPIIGQLLKELNEAQAIGKIKTTLQAVALAKKITKKSHLDNTSK